MSINLYSATWCSQCSQVKDMLMQKGVAYEVIDVDEDTEAMDALVAQGIRGLPVLAEGETLYVGLKGALEFLK